jgi:hypothetical protein
MNSGCPNPAHFVVVMTIMPAFAPDASITVPAQIGGSNYRPVLTPRAGRLPAGSGASRLTEKQFFGKSTERWESLRIHCTTFQ